MSKKWFLWEHILWCLLVLRPFYYQFVPMELFATIVILIFIVKYVAEGFTIIGFTMVTLFTMGILSQTVKILVLQYLAAIVVALLALFPFKVYELPQTRKPVGFRQDLLQNGLHYFQFYPLQSYKPFTLKSIKWNYSGQISKMFQYKRISNKLVKKIAHFIMSYADKYKLKIADGTQQKTQNGIALSHGKGGTPFYYSSLMMYYGAEGYRVGAAQHSEISRVNFNSIDEVKSYRGKEVIKRAEEYSKVIKKLKTENLVLIGHSYGCATLIQAYHSLDSTIKSKISKIILLDPWLFPLDTATFNKKITCKMLIMANEDFVANQSVYQLNSQFIKIHNVEYILWKDACHLHQTDVGFINGNFLGVIKNSGLSSQMFERNINSIDLFLKGQRVEQGFGDKNLGRSFKPAKFHPVNWKDW